jgi:hypothetical protein
LRSAIGGTISSSSGRSHLDWLVTRGCARAKPQVNELARVPRYLDFGGARPGEPRAIAEAAERARRDEALLTERVALARTHGRSWNRIAAALGVSRQAARQRFGGKVGA